MTSLIRFLLALPLAAVLIFSWPPPSHARGSEASPAQRTPVMQLFAVVYGPGPNWRLGAPMKDQDLRRHFFHLRDLQAGGVVVVAGPLGDDGGLVILRASDQAAASALVAADPAVVAGVFIGEAKPFLPRIGGGEPLVVAKPAAR